MKIFEVNKVTQQSSKSGFTMVEIAISMAIAAFALVAILGNLPKGIQVQQENREDTLVNQDAALIMEAIRNGARGFRGLTNQVDRIEIVSSTGVNSILSLQDPAPIPQLISSPANLIALLSTPKYLFTDNTGNAAITNSVSAVIRSLSGSSGEKDPDLADFAFKYRVESEVIPFNPFPSNFALTFTNSPNQNLASLNPMIGTATQTNNWRRARSMNQNFYELKLTFRWPVLNDGSVGRRKKVYRTMVQSPLIVTNITQNLSGFYFSMPQAN